MTGMDDARRAPALAAGSSAGVGASQPVLELDGLRVAYPVPRGRARAADTTRVAIEELSLTLLEGSTLALVGESGAGKSTLLSALLGTLPRGAVVSARGWRVREADGSWRDTAGAAGPSVGTFGIIPQDPARALDPLIRIGGHFRELHRYLLGVRSRAESRRLAVDALHSVGIDEPEQRLGQFPHELSGGLQQRVLIALALVARPRILLADEPTSNLDASVQRRVLDLLDALRRERRLSVLLVTHDLAIAAERADRLIVVRHGRVVEHGPTRDVLAAPANPYTRELLASVPSELPPRTAALGASGTDRSSDRPATAGTATGWPATTTDNRDTDADARTAPAAPAAERPALARDRPAPLLEARGLRKRFGTGEAALLAVDGVDLTLERGQTLGVVGPSGAGKSTLVRLVSGLERPDAGAVLLDGVSQDSTTLSRRRFTRRVQLVYQNPASSLNPALTAGRIIAEPLEAFRIGSRAARRARALELLDQVRLPASLAGRRPEELSGGQQQRVAIARALALEPDVLVLDEPVSALDQAVQFALLTLLDQLQRETRIAYLFVSHDLGVIRAVADEVLVLDGGRVAERGPTEQIFTTPQNARTRSLLDGIPRPFTHPSEPLHPLTPTERTPVS